jgi:hypothetical protein
VPLCPNPGIGPFDNQSPVRQSPWRLSVSQRHPDWKHFSVPTNLVNAPSHIRGPADTHSKLLKCLVFDRQSVTVPAWKVTVPKDVHQRLTCPQIDYELTGLCAREIHESG